MSLINREELLRRLKLHGRRKDGKTVIPEWMQVAIKEVEHMPEDTTTKLAYWEVGTDVDDTLPFAPEYYWFGIFYKCSHCGFVTRSTLYKCPQCRSTMQNGTHIDPGHSVVGAQFMVTLVIRQVIRRMPEAELLRIHRGETPTKEEIEASNRHDKLLQQEYAASESLPYHYLYFILYHCTFAICSSGYERNKRF